MPGRLQALHSEIRADLGKIAWAVRTRQRRREKLSAALRGAAFFLRELFARDTVSARDCAGNRFLSPRGNFTTFVTSTLGLRDPLVMRAAFQHLRPGDHVIDVGANIGCYSLYLGRAVGDAGRVTSFEPNPATHEFLRRNISANRASNIRPVMKGLGRATGTLRLVTSMANCGEAHVSGEQEVGDVEIAVSTLDLEIAPEERTRVRYLKIDVEGFEAEVIAGGRELLAGNRRILVQIENEPRFAGRYRTGFHTAHQLLTDLGYRPFTTEDGRVYVAVQDDLSLHENLIYQAS